MKKIILVSCILILLPCSAFSKTLIVPSFFDTIQKAIDFADDGDTVVLEDGIYNGIGNYNIRVEKSITIRSENGFEKCVIDCQSQGRGIYVSSGDADIALEGLTIKNGVDSSFYDGGGAVYTVYAGRENLIITNCAFENNQASMGGAISTYSAAFVNCKFTNNSATGYGSGGAVHCHNSSSFSNCEFINNKSLVKYYYIGGGAVSSLSSTYTDCVFTGNITDGYGGAVRLYGNCTSPSLFTGCIFTGNKAVEGGAVFSRDPISFTGCKFTDNAANDCGGAIYSETEGSSLADGCNFMDNRAIEGGGAYLLESSSHSFAFTNCNFDGNIVTENGGAIYSSLSLSSFTNCKFNVNQSIKMGGAVFSDDSKTIFDQCKFFNNQSGTSGGALHTFSSLSEVTRSIFTGNMSSYGGAIYVDSPSTATNCIFTGNIAQQFGGALLTYSPLSVFNCTFSLNKSEEQGGAVWSNKPITIKHSILWDDSSPEGSEIYSLDTTSIMYSNIQGGSIINGNINQIPLFLSLDTTGDLYIRPDSPCINKIPLNETDVAEIDFAGNLRPSPEDPLGDDIIIDMGAYEYQYNCFLLTGTDWNNPDDWYDSLEPGSTDFVIVVSQGKISDGNAVVGKVVINEGTLSISGSGGLYIGGL